MNEKMRAALDKTLDNIAKMSPDEFHLSFFGFTLEQEEAYDEEAFSKDIEYLKGFMVDGVYVFEPKYDNLPEPEMSKLFWNYISKHSRSYEGDNEIWPEYIQELPKFGIRISTIHGQGSVTTVEMFDFKSVEYIAKNGLRLKRESFERQKREIEELLKGLPNVLDEVEFETTANGEVVNDTGVVLKVYTKKKTVRYLIDSVNNGNIIVFVNNDKHPNDKVTVTKKHYADDDSFGM